jgi:hypothetical protein
MLRRSKNPKNIVQQKFANQTKNQNFILFKDQNSTKKCFFQKNYKRP